MPTPTGRKGIEEIKPGTYRVGIQVTITDPDTGRKTRKWLRETHTYPATLTRAQQLDLAEADRQVLIRSRAGAAEPVNIAAPPTQDIMTIDQLVSMWQAIVLAGASADYRKTALSMLNLHILPHLGQVRAAHLTRLQINAWITMLHNTPNRKSPTKTLSARTVRHCYVTLSTVYNWAVDNELIDRSPFERTHAPKVRKHRPNYIDDEQAVDLLRQLSHEDNMSFRAAVLLALTAGLRLGEVDAITWSDINWQRCTIDITKAVHQTPELGRVVSDPKTSESVRIIAASAEMLALLDETRKYQQDIKAQIGSRYHDQDLIVCKWDGTPLNKDTPSKQWHKFAAKYGYDGVTFHNLRTSHATILLSNNIDAVAVAGRLGHTDAVTTLKYYAMLVSRRDRDSAAVMDSIIATATGNHRDTIQILEQHTERKGTCTICTMVLQRNPIKP